MLLCGGNGRAGDGLEGPLYHRERHHVAGGAVLCRVQLGQQWEEGQLDFEIWRQVTFFGRRTSTTTATENGDGGMRVRCINI